MYSDTQFFELQPKHGVNIKDKPHSTVIKQELKVLHVLPYRYLSPFIVRRFGSICSIYSQGVDSNKTSFYFKRKAFVCPVVVPVICMIRLNLLIYMHYMLASFMQEI